MADRIISTADLSQIAGNLDAISDRIDFVTAKVDQVDDNLHTVYKELADLAKEFQDYVEQTNRQHNLSVAETRLVKVRQEIKNRFGHFDEVRRATVGIVQADDLEMVRKDTISTITEEMMLTSPNYWLAPCLVAVSAWINDNRELAETAVKEAIKRDDEKTSLLFSLICRRANRKPASLKWAHRYMCNQDEENLDRQTIIIIDAFSSGLLGVDSEGLISQKLADWLDKIIEKPGFSENQIEQWSEAISLYAPTTIENKVSYPYLKKYSPTWPRIEEVMKGAYLHENLLNYFVTIFSKPISTNSLKKQLDEVLYSLVSKFDEEELDLRKSEKLNQLIIDHDGNINEAQRNMNIEQTAFEQKKDFSQLLTDAAMKPESSGASLSTQKLSIALSRDWIDEAYRDVIANNRSRIPHEIELSVNGFNDRTIDASDESALLNKYSRFMGNQKLQKLTQFVPSTIGLVAGIAIAAIGLLMMLSDNALLGLIAVVGGGYLALSTFSKNQKIDQQRAQIESDYNALIEQGQQVIRALLAETVDFRKDFAKADKESQKVLDFLEQISPEQYVASLSGAIRRLNVKED